MRAGTRSRRARRSSWYEPRFVDIHAPCESLLTSFCEHCAIHATLQAEQELITILPHFQIKENSGVLNFIGVSTADMCFAGM